MSGRDVRQTIVQLLSNLGDSREVRTYLDKFSSLDQTRFAVIKIGGAVLRDRLSETAGALAFLQTVGLTPIVLHGGGPQLDSRLAGAGIVTTRHNGLRVTTPDVLDLAHEVFAEQNLALVDAITSQGVPAQGVIQGVFEAREIDPERLGLVGEPTEVNTDLLRSIIDSGAIPIITCLGVTPDGTLLNMNADAATRLLVQAVQPMKIIFLSDPGGLVDAEGGVIDTINLATDYDHLMRQDWLHSGMRLKLTEIKLLLDDSPPSTSVSITTPNALARELFTHGGAGTLVRQGEPILRSTPDEPPDMDRLSAVISAGFGRKLRTSWWDEIDVETVYVPESYRAVAVVTRVDDFFYLDKFAVVDQARGEGIARAVWTEMTKDHGAFFWRSRTDNSFNAFYNEEADGCVRRGPWFIYWKGEDDFDRIAPAVKRIAELPDSFEDR